MYYKSDTNDYKDFLLKLDQCRNKIVYARIISLTFDERPIEQIEGRVTQGNINIDGNSVVRRTCSLSIVAQNYDYKDYYWGLNTKFKLEIGLENLVDDSMPKIIWFNQGIYIVSSFNIGYSVSNLTISIQGKDKMCLLNGEVGGALESSVDFGVIEDVQENGVTSYTKVEIKDIIKHMLHQYGRESYNNIIINDLDTLGLELLEYRYLVPMYLYRPKTVGNSETPIYTNMILENNNSKYYIKDEDGVFQEIKLSELDNSHLDLLVDPLTGQENPESVYDSSKNEFIFAKVEYGQTAGYRTTKLVYAGDLIAAAGETITSVLDKIKNMLGGFEYFYDINGKFIFQKKKTFVNTTWAPINDSDGNKEYIEHIYGAFPVVYTFNGNNLIASYQNSPNLTNVRNDYSIWGERQSINGTAIPVHLRYAIDNKPTYYKTFDGKVYSSDTTDWREIIYQMALDYFQYAHDENGTPQEDFLPTLANNNLEYYPLGVTGYEQYYTDLEGFWRQLYYPYVEQYSDVPIDENEIEGLTPIEIDIKKLETVSIAQSTQIIDQLEKEIAVNQQTLASKQNQLQEEKDKENPDNEEIVKLEKEIQRLNEQIKNEQYNLANEQSKLLNLQTDLNELKSIQENYYLDENDKYLNWNKNVYKNPEVLNFWFDFLDVDGELNQFNVRSIGIRSKVVNDSNIKAIYFRETPEVIFTDSVEDLEDRLSGFKYIQIKDIESMFTISSQGKSAKTLLEELLYKHGYAIESVTITTIPIYYLEPNTRIYLSNQIASIEGDYIITSLSIPLTYNGIMTIVASKAVENIF